MTKKGEANNGGMSAETYQSSGTKAGEKEKFQLKRGLLKEEEKGFQTRRELWVVMESGNRRGKTRVDHASKKKTAVVKLRGRTPSTREKEERTTS